MFSKNFYLKTLRSFHQFNFFSMASECIIARQDDLFLSREKLDTLSVRRTPIVHQALKCLRFFLAAACRISTLIWGTPCVILQACRSKCMSKLYEDDSSPLFANTYEIYIHRESYSYPPWDGAWNPLSPPRRIAYKNARVFLGIVDLRLIRKL